MHPPIPDVIIVADPLKDLDDEHTLCFAACLHREKIINLRCVVANLNPAELRARAAKGTLKLLGLGEIPVGVGLPLSQKELVPELVPYMAEPSEVEPNGLSLMTRTLEECADHNVILVLQSGFADALQLLREKRELFLLKIFSVAMMGGVKESCLEDGRLVPDTANNNEFDAEAAAAFYSELQSSGIPAVVTMRAAAYAAPVPFSAHERLEATGNPIGASMRQRQRAALQGLWEAACSPPGSVKRGSLPGDRGRGWFIDAFCAGKDPAIAGGGDIRPFVVGFHLHDPINLAAAIPELRERFFDPIKLELAGRSAENSDLVIGLDRARSGVKNPEALRDFILDGEVTALSKAVQK